MYMWRNHLQVNPREKILPLKTLHGWWHKNFALTTRTRSMSTYVYFSKETQLSISKSHSPQKVRCFRIFILSFYFTSTLPWAISGLVTMCCKADFNTLLKSVAFTVAKKV